MGATDGGAMIKIYLRLKVLRGKFKNNLILQLLNFVGGEI
jgi:hypothetical protein